MNFNLLDDIDRMVYREDRSNSGSSMNFQQDNISSPSQLSSFPEHTPIGMAYVPFQQWGKTYEADEALQHGTMFPDLDYPFLGGGSHE